MSVTKLPQTEAGWEKDLSKFNATGDLHKLPSASPASEINLKEFLALRTLWIDKDLRTLQESYEDFGMKRSHAEEATEILKNRTPGFREYLRCIQNNIARGSGEPLPTQVAGFAVALHNQREILAKPANNNEETKVFLRSPVTLRPRGPLGTFAGQTDSGIANDGEPHTPQRAVPQPIFDTPSSVQSLFHVQSPFDVQSPFGNGFPNPAPAADEQIVNIALVGLLQGLTLHLRRCANWTIRRKIFRCGLKGSNAEFEARTDGALQHHPEEHCMAILEVKARSRRGQTQIQMQESAQMAAWIYTEPESYWEVEKNPGVRHRLFISQDRAEIYLTFATYDSNYAQYLRQPPSPTTAKSFLRMRQFGPFRITEWKEMKFFGQMILTFMLGPGQSILPSITEEQPKKDPAERPPTKGLAEEPSAKDLAEESSAKDLTEEPSAKDLAEKPRAKALPIRIGTPLAHRLRSHRQLEDPFVD